MKKGAKVALPTVAALGAGSALAVGAIPGADGRIQGCYQTINGNLRVVDDAADCKNGETPIKWSQTGPEGPSGPQGQTGPPGPAGAPGAPGDASLLVGGVPLAADPVDAELTIDGSKSDVELQSTSFGITSPIAGKGEFATFRFQKLLDGETSPIIADRAFNGEVSKVTIKISEVGQKVTPVTYKFHDVRFTEYKQGGDREPPLLERVEMTFNRVDAFYQDSKISKTWALNDK